jgi:hypothetical protein
VTCFGECVHWDLWGPASTKSLGGKYYAAHQTDNNSHEVEIYFLEKRVKPWKPTKPMKHLLKPTVME